MRYDSYRPILYAYSNTPIEPEFKTLSDMVARFHLPLEPDNDLEPSDALASIYFPVQEIFLSTELLREQQLEHLALYQDVVAGRKGWQSFFEFQIKPGKAQQASQAPKRKKPRPRTEVYNGIGPASGKHKEGRSSHEGHLARSNGSQLGLENGPRVITQESAVTSVTQETSPRRPSSVGLETSVSAPKSYSFKGGGEDVSCHLSKKRICLLEASPVRESLCYNWSWAKTFSTLPRGIVSSCFSFSSLCVCGPLNEKSTYLDPDEKTHPLGPIHADNGPTPSHTDSHLSPNQPPEMELPMYCGISNPADSVQVMSPSNIASLYSGADTCSLNSSVMMDNQSLSRSDQCLLLGDHLGMGSQMDDQWQGSMSSRDIWANATEALEVILRADLKPPQLPIMDPKWKPPRPGSNISAKNIAAIMDGTLSFPFRIIQFIEFRDAFAYGRHSERITDVLHGISHVYHMLRQLFTGHPKQRALFQKAKEVFLPSNG